MSGIHHLALRVRDCEVAATFYARVFGLKEMRRSAPDGRLTAVWFRAGGSVLMLERALLGQGDDQGSAHVLVFAASDLAAAEEQLGELGVPVTGRTSSTLYFQDPDGHRLGLSSFAFDAPTS